MLRYRAVECSDGSGGGTLFGSTLAFGEIASKTSWQVGAMLGNNRSTANSRMAVFMIRSFLFTATPYWMIQLSK